MTSDAHSTADIVIREAHPSEYEVIGALTVVAYRAGEGLPRGDDDPYAAVLADPASRPPDTTVLVAEDGGAILGAVTYILFGSEVADVCVEGEAELRMLAVDPAAQGRGIGGRLMRAGLDRARAEGRTAMALCVVGSNTGARALYERLGFVRVPERDWEPAPAFTLLAYRHDLAPDSHPMPRAAWGSPMFS